MAERDITVLGAGVIGLTTAMLLSRDPKNSVTVIAKHMPGDYDIEYASPWAGASYEPVGAPGTKLQKYEKETAAVLFQLCRDVKEAGIVFQPCVIYNRKKDADTATGQWFKAALAEDTWLPEVFPDFRLLPKSGLPAGVDAASTFTTVCINTPIYLSWLLGQCAHNGVVIRRGVVNHVADAASLHHSGRKADLVMNCTGLSSLKLGGVKDQKLYPARGQIVVVRQEPHKMTTISGSDDGPDETTYTMTRAAGGGTVLGGCLQVGNWDSQVDLSMASRIMKRAVELLPDLTGGKGAEALDVVRHAVGLRPMREGGPRIESEMVDGVRVIHNYGHGGYGYQSSYGAVNDALSLVEPFLKEKARL